MLRSSRATMAKRLVIASSTVLAVGLLPTPPASANPPPGPSTDSFVTQVAPPALLADPDGVGTLKLNTGFASFGEYGTGNPDFTLTVNAPRGVDFTSVNAGPIPGLGTQPSCSFTTSSVTCQFHLYGTQTVPVDIGLRYNGDTPDPTPETTPTNIAFPGGKAMVSPGGSNPNNDQADLKIVWQCT
ncbi:hypothetical protein [Streptomyces sp. BPTC-684]|uniref:hypothetical protein n=1 Tax=Streptomyces sp. BPTC-684 TaxID=3043734 RepID=UPI0024B209DA|nr:hypothetical protein [Streptomyces sp. BPTC-684]WHM40890.1 hypothetical protein QIY60_31090 [Streptomyces sp. BPTC-684]